MLNKKRRVSFLLVALLVSGVAIAAQVGTAAFKKRHKLPPSAATNLALHKQGPKALPQFGEALADLDASFAQCL